MNNSDNHCLMRNDSNSDNWLQIELRGTKSNRDAVGAVVYLESAGWERMQQVKSGSGYQSSSQKALFGLGQRDSIERYASYGLLVLSRKLGNKSQPKSVCLRRRSIVCNGYTVFMLFREHLPSYLLPVGF